MTPFAAPISRRLALGLTSVLMAGCTFVPGTGFAQLGPESLAIVLQPGEGRIDGDGRLKTDLGYRVRFDTLRLAVSDLTFQSAGGTAGPVNATAVFDPAKPPAGYSLCHNGHCHRSDGALIDYADIQAEMQSGGAPAFSDTLKVPLPATLDLLPLGTKRTLTFCASTCHLDRGDWKRAQLGLGTLEASGSVRDGSSEARLGPGGERRWTLRLTPTAMTRRIDVTISRSSPAILSLPTQLSLSDQLFDRIDWSQLPADGTTTALESRPALVTQLIQNFGESQLAITDASRN
jgi:hypothetical protein